MWKLFIGCIRSGSMFNKSQKENAMEKGAGIAIGIGVGVALGVATGNMGIWIALGVVLGVLIENGELDDILAKFGIGEEAE